MKWPQACLLAGFFLGMAGCASGPSAIGNVALQLVSAPDRTTPVFDPALRYLRATINGGVTYLVLGFTDPHPDGPVEVWYSPAGEVLRLQHGRLVGTTGLSTDWRSVRQIDAPVWPAQAGSVAQQRFVRQRDLMPGYRFGIEDRIVQSPIAAPADTALAGVEAAALRWYEERSSTQPASAALPAARFGVRTFDGVARVVYSEQCVAPRLCLSLEQWPPAATPRATGS